MELVPATPGTPVVARTEKQLVALAQAAIGKLAEIEDVEEAKLALDQAALFREAAKRFSHSKEASFVATELRIRAERRLGELLAGMAIHGGDRRSDSFKKTSCLLETVGLQQRAAHRYQTEAALPEEQFEDYVRRSRESGRELTSQATYKAGKAWKAAQNTGVEIVVTPHEAGGPAVTINSLDDLAERGEKFGCIYADPPWRYDNSATRSAVKGEYPTMTIEELCELPVGRLAADKSHLHMWVTNGHLERSFEIIKAWGFEFKSSFVWIKNQIGIGNYWRNRHEIMLLAVKGGLVFRDHGLPSSLQHDRLGHSVKPYEIRKLVERASPGPYLELFGRRAVQGWTVFGNQISRDLFTEAMDEQHQ